MPQEEAQDIAPHIPLDITEKRIKIPTQLNTLLLTDCRIANPFNIEGSVERLMIAILYQYYEQPENRDRLAKALNLLQPPQKPL